jgi:outer membrane protein assembly factor BamA
MSSGLISPDIVKGQELVDTFIYLRTLTVQVDEGQQYRLEDIRFNNSRAISNVDALRSLFPVKDGDIFSREEVAKGLDNLRFAYRQNGYINFTSIPNTQFNDERQIISLGKTSMKTNSST